MRGRCVNQGDITGCGGYCGTELKMCSLLQVTTWKICVNALQALVPRAVTPSCQEVTAKCTQDADCPERDAADKWVR